MIVTANQFDKEVNEIARVLSETGSAKYFYRIECQDGKPYVHNTHTTSVTYGNENGFIKGICDTYRKKEGATLSVTIPCTVTNDGSVCFNPLVLKNIILYGAIQEDRSEFKLYLKLYFNEKKSVRNKILIVRHLSKEKIFEIVALLNLAADKIDLDYFKFDELSSSVVYMNESILIHKIVTGMKYKIYERYTNRPGRDDYFDVLKGIMNVPKNDYFKDLVKGSLKTDNTSIETSNDFHSRLSAAKDESEISSITLSHDSGWHEFPKPNESIEEGYFDVDLFLVDVIKKFNKYEYLLKELTMKPNELPDKWEIQDSEKLLCLMKAILKEKLSLNDNYSAWYDDSKLKSIEGELRTKVQHFGYLYKVDNVFFRKGKLMANLFLKLPTAISIPQYFENNHWLKSVILVPICYTKNIEDFFRLDEEAFGILKELQNAGLTK